MIAATYSDSLDSLIVVERTAWPAIPDNYVLSHAPTFAESATGWALRKSRFMPTDLNGEE